MLQQHFAIVRQRIADAATACGRAPDSVALLAVSKSRDAAEIVALHALGQTRFGESYLQEALAKLDALADRQLEWHFIGPLQSNKTRPIAERFDWVHSVDRLKLAQRLNDQRPAGLAPLSVCLQVNISDESSKRGIAPEALDAVVDATLALPRLRLRGLMAIPAPTADPELQRAPFRRLRRLQQGLIERGVELDTLSIGMSDDLEAAIAEGATMVRIGTALFGPRDNG